MPKGELQHEVKEGVVFWGYKENGRLLGFMGISHTGEVDRGFMDSIYFRDPLGQLIECACYKFEPPNGSSHAEVLFEAHQIRVGRDGHHIGEEHLTEAIRLLVERRQRTLSADRSAKDPYTDKPPVWD